jgi:hypothetical protein
MDLSEMRAFQFREENGYLPDEVYIPTDEDDPWDPEQREIITLVMEGYAVTNEARRAERARIRISILEQTLREHGIEIPD